MTSRNWVVVAGALALLWPTVAAAGPQEKAMAQTIAQQVKQSGKLSNYRLGVSYDDGVATLSGEVADASQARAAAVIASRVSGVTKVVNRLTISAPSPGAVQATKENSGGLLMALKASKGQPSTQQSAQAPVQQVSAARQQPLTRRVQPTPQQPRLRPTQNAPVAMGPSRMPGVQPVAYQQGQVQQAQCSDCYAGAGGYSSGGGGVGYENPSMPGYAWPSYAAHPNYAALTYPKQYSPSAWPYIGPFYPYPQVPLGWRKVCLEWDDGWWFLDFSHHQCQ